MNLPPTQGVRVCSLSRVLALGDRNHGWESRIRKDEDFVCSIEK